jgi:hypothetical protein
LWPSTPTPKAEAYALHSDVMRWPLLRNAPHFDNEPDQGLVPVLSEVQDQRADVLAGKSSYLSRQCGQSVKVKNTFIDGFLDDEEQNDDPAVAACKSWCVGATRQTEPSSPEGAAQAGLSADPPSPLTSPPSPILKPQASAGADLHGTGRCRPCGWFWRPQGCVLGAECGHCHMCPEGELKARKKAKLAAMRTRKHAGSANDSQ